MDSGAHNALIFQLCVGDVTMATRSLHKANAAWDLRCCCALGYQQQCRRLIPAYWWGIKAPVPDSVQVVDIVRGYRCNWSDGTIYDGCAVEESIHLRQMDKSFFTGRGASLQRHWLRLYLAVVNPPLCADDAEEMCELLRDARCVCFLCTVPAPCQSLPRSLPSKVE